jgi:hypothetical protein
MGGSYNTHRRGEKCIQYIKEKMKGRDHLGPGHIWEDTIKIDLKAVGGEVLD